MGEKKTKSTKAKGKKDNSLDDLKKNIKHQKNALNKILKNYSK